MSANSNLINDIESKMETIPCVQFKENNSELTSSFLNKKNNKEEFCDELKKRLAEKRELEKCIVQFSITTFGVVCILPIAICDLYFGFTDTSCSNKQPSNLAMSVKLYLLVSGFISLASVSLLLLGVYFIDKLNKIDDKNVWVVCCGGISVMLISLFAVIWNILGATVFWGYIYQNGNCNKSFSTYVFVSLILKLIATFIGLFSNKKDKK